MASKILIDSRLYGLENTGIGRYLVNLIGELSLLDKKNDYVVLLKNKYFNELNLPDNWNKVRCDYKHYSFEEQIKLPNLINKINPDLVHFPHFNIPIFWKGKFIVTIHDMTMHTANLKATQLAPIVYFLKRLPYKYIFKKALENSAKIITPTKTIKRDLLQVYKISENKTTSVYEGVDIKYSKESYKGNINDKYKIKNSYFIYTGNLYPHKNIKSAVEAISLINQERKQKISLLIVTSKNTFSQDLIKYAEKLGVEKQVRLLGYVPDEELVALYKKTVAFVYPSLSEGFGLQGLEAMLAGCPVLASNIPVFKEVYKNNAFYFNPYSCDSILKVMKEILEIDSRKRKEIINKAKRFSKNYSWGKMAKETLTLYKSALRS